MSACQAGTSHGVPLPVLPALLVALYTGYFVFLDRRVAAVWLVANIALGTPLWACRCMEVLHNSPVV